MASAGRGRPRRTRCCRGIGKYRFVFSLSRECSGVRRLRAASRSGAWVHFRLQLQLYIGYRLRFTVKFSPRAGPGRGRPGNGREMAGKGAGAAPGTSREMAGKLLGTEKIDFLSAGGAPG